MNQPPQTEKQTGRRIVSKGTYVKTQADRAATTFIGICFFFIAIIFGFATVFMLAQCAASITSIAATHANTPNTDTATIDIFSFLTRLLGLALCGYLSYTCLKCVQSSLQYVINTDPGVPLTHANTADLPAPDSLVRASEEPVQEPQTVLLRAATATTDVQEAQLLRASAEPE